MKKQTRGRNQAVPSGRPILRDCSFCKGLLRKEKGISRETCFYSA